MSLTTEYTKKGSIEPSKVYNLRDMIAVNAFDWIPGVSRSKYRRYAELISKDFVGANVMQAIKIPHGQSSTYQIKGRNLQKFVDIYGPGLRLTNQRYGNKRDRKSSREKGRDGD